MDYIKKGILKLFFVSFFGLFSSVSFAFDYEWNDNNEYLLNYVKDNKDSIVRWAEFSYSKGKPYRDYIETIAEQYDVPKELYVLAAIESSYNPKAVSTAGAAGMWQFMKGTSKDMGLSNHINDNRKDWEKSTVAAMKYIKYLAEDHFYGDYELAILAYNAGVGTVKKAILKNQSADVWVIIQDKQSFRKESREYLPKFIAYINYFKYLDSNSAGPQQIASK